MALFDTAIHEWQDGTRRLADTPDRERAALELVADAAVAELRRRLGSAYTVDELVDLYDRGTSWVLDLAYRVAPEAPWAWDERTVAGAAFARYLRGASDFAGGRRLESQLRMRLRGLSRQSHLRLGGLSPLSHG
jgi:hypothetical protein